MALIEPLSSPHSGERQPFLFKKFARVITISAKMLPLTPEARDSVYAMGLTDENANLSIPVELLIVDPWEWPHHRFLGRIILMGCVDEYCRKEVEKCLVRSSCPLEYEGASYEYFVVTPRQITSLQPLFNNRMQSNVSILCIPEARIQSGSPLLDTGWWRGGTPNLRGEIFLV